MKKKLILIAVVWFVVIGLGAMAYKWVFVPKQQEEVKKQQEEEKKAVLVQTGSDARYKYQINLALDSFSGYAVLRSEDFRSELNSRSIKLNLVDDGADYNKRLKSLQSGEVHMAAFTIDALIKSSVNLGDMPATIISLLDETKGADAMVGSKSIPNIDSLNDPNTKFVITPDSPSETLARVVMAYFNLDRLGADPWIKANSAKDVYEQYKGSKPTDKKVFVLWEPYVSRLTENPDYRVLVDSSKFKGYIVDVLVVNRDFLVKNEDVVKQVAESYFRANFSVRHRMVDLVLEDSKVLGDPLKLEQAKKLVSGIQWKNTQENYAHFGLTSGTGYQHVDDMIANITTVLKKTGAISGDPTNGRPNLLYYDKIVRNMFETNFHPGFGSEEVRQENKLVALGDEEWKNLRPVGTLQVPRLVFARGTAKLTDASEETLSDLAKKLKTWPQYYLVVRGHCSKDGDVAANQKLATDRSNATMEWLVKAGIDKNRIKADISEPNGSTTVAFILGQVAY